MTDIIKQSLDTDYGPNNPEPLAMKDSAKVRDPEKDALHAALEYLGDAAVDGAEPENEQTG